MTSPIHSRRLSQSLSTNTAHATDRLARDRERDSNSNTHNISSSLSSLARPLFSDLTETERGDVINKWQSVLGRDIAERNVVVVDADTSVEEACDKLLSEGIECLVVIDASPSSPSPSSETETTPRNSPWIGLFDFSDVNAFLTLAATRHTLSPEVIKANERLDRIVEAAKAGRVPVRLICNFSDKNPYVVLPHDTNIIAVLEKIARGAHRVFLQDTTKSNLNTGSHLIGMISDRRLLSFFSSCITEIHSLEKVTSRFLFEFSFPLDILRAVVAASSLATVLDAMKLMSEEGVSSVAVVDEETGILIGGVSVTDIGRVVVPSQSNQILGTPLKHFITSIKLPDGSTDGADKYPVYSVFPTSSLVYTIEKLLATNARRLFVTDEEESMNPTMSPSSPGNLTGVISILDVLSLFAHLARIPDVDPRRMQRHRRASSTSSRSSSRSERELFLRPRSNSRASIRRSPSFGAAVMSSPSGSAVTFSGGSSPVGVRPKSPVILAIPDIGSALGGSMTFGTPLGRRGSLSSAALRAWKRDSVQ